MTACTCASGSSATSPEGRRTIATRQVEEQRAALGFGLTAGVHSALEDVQLGLTHRAFEPEQQTIIVGRRVEDAIAVGDEGVEQSADLE